MVLFVVFARGARAFAGLVRVNPLGVFEVRAANALLLLLAAIVFVGLFAGNSSLVMAPIGAIMILFGLRSAFTSGASVGGLLFSAAVVILGVVILLFVSFGGPTGCWRNFWGACGK